MIRRIMLFFNRLFESKEDRLEHKHLEELRQNLDYIQNHPEILENLKKTNSK